MWISSLFKGLTFVLTQGAHPLSEPKDLNTSMTSALESETETEQQADDAQSVKNTGFIRAAITQTIIENGGKWIKKLQYMCILYTVLCILTSTSCDCV